MSTEPCVFFGAGGVRPRKWRVRLKARRREVGLQWGRGRSAAEMTVGVWPPAAASTRFNGAAAVRPRKYVRMTCPPVRADVLQWGRGRSAAEISIYAAPARMSEALQWGRGRSAAEIAQRSFDLHFPAVASMGPRPFGRGNEYVEEGDYGPVSGFNGAAAVRPRKCRWTMSGLSHRRRFNGAAAVRPRKSGSD